MDPVTAIFNFLSTPEGQKLVAPLVTANAAFVGIIGDLIQRVHDHNPPASPATPAKA